MTLDIGYQLTPIYCYLQNPPNFIITSFEALSLFMTTLIVKVLQLVEDKWDTIQCHTSFYCTSNSRSFKHQCSCDLSNTVLNDHINLIEPLINVLLCKNILIRILNLVKIPKILATCDSYHP